MKFIFIFAALILLTPGTALAYFDAGTGSLILTALVGVLTSIALSWWKVKSFICSLFRTNKASSPSANTDATAGGAEETGFDANAVDRR